ncbi:probable protein phosphatase 2C 77 [Phalaenopsis equestris]|uniref:probable protein phosphatase 2C 77 n=1 Tax=Phalaenopsis equestris TaxID=78828 RepID=UPI0009E326D3|nr:probable protein phosphatase 2C 77 [Phalaenopsis equestris]
MVEQLECIWAFIYMVLHLFPVLRKAAYPMAICSNTSASSPPCLSWKRLAESPALASKKARDGSRGLRKEEIESGGLQSVLTELVVEKVERFCEEKPKAGECLSDTVASGVKKLRKRPAKIVIPSNNECGGNGSLGIGEAFFRKDEDVGRDIEVEGSGYCLASRRGTRHMMEDGYGVMTNIHGDSKQAFFGVFDGHGGRAAVDFLSEKLGNNIITAVEEVEEENEDRLKLAIKAGYLLTDNEFINKGVSSGACAATVLLKNGELHVSNVGDCRVVMSRKGIADALTTDHRPGREDERARIENLGGYVSFHNGVWRVQDSLAISRAIGDVNLKEWIISEPETRRLQLTQDCEFLIMASDGLWDKVSNQEAVDVVMKKGNSMQTCKELVEISCNRGNRDDITVMVVDLQTFCTVG